MAELSPIDEEVPDYSEVLGRLDPRAERILTRIDASSRTDIEREITDAFDKEALRNLREKVFELVRDKAARCLLQPSAGGIFGKAFVIDPQDDPRDAKTFVDQWEPVPRRAEHKFASDITEYIAFVTGIDRVLPVKLIRGSSLDKGVVEEEVPKDCLDSQLVDDIAQSTTPVDVEVIDSSAGTETHVVTIHPTPEQHGSHDSAASEDGSESESDDSESECENNPPQAEPVITSIACPTCHSKLIIEVTSQAIVNELQRAIKMADRSSDGEKPVSTNVFELQSDYVEGMCKEVAAKVDEILEWKREVDRRLNTIETATKHEPTAKTRPKQRSLDPPIDGRSQRINEKTRSMPEEGNRGEAASCSEVEGMNIVVTRNEPDKPTRQESRGVKPAQNSNRRKTGRGRQQSPVAKNVRPGKRGGNPYAVLDPDRNTNTQSVIVTKTTTTEKK